MMECKKALAATSGDIQLAIEELRKSGRAKADKKAGRVAAEGIVVIRTGSDGKQAVMLEINSETDFVARDANFLAFADAVAETALAAKVKDVQALLALPLSGQSMTIEEARQALVAKVGENIKFVVSHQSPWCNNHWHLSHGNRIGVIVELEGDNQELARDIAMHIAAAKPLVITPEEVPSDIVAKEKEIYMAQAANSGKPKEIIEKMVTGRFKKFLDEVSLLGQPFVKDPEVIIANLLNKHVQK